MRLQLRKSLLCFGALGYRAKDFFQLSFCTLHQHAWNNIDDRQVVHTGKRFNSFLFYFAKVCFLGNKTADLVSNCFCNIAGGVELHCKRHAHECRHGHQFRIELFVGVVVAYVFLNRLAKSFVACTKRDVSCSSESRIFLNKLDSFICNSLEYSCAGLSSSDKWAGFCCPCQYAGEWKCPANAFANSSGVAVYGVFGSSFPFVK